MTARAYNLNPDQAREGDSFSSRITETGPVTGIFKVARAVRAQSGAEGIEFTFEADNGATANYLSLYTHNGAGEEIYGLKKLQALMTCVKARSLNPADQQVLLYDKDQKKEVSQQATVYPDLMNKKVGVLFQKVLSIYNGKDQEKVEMFAFFDAQTRMTASEILDKATEAKQLDQLIHNVHDKDTRSAPSAAAQNHAAAMNYDEDDDLPF